MLGLAFKRHYSHSSRALLSLCHRGCAIQDRTYRALALPPHWAVNSFTAHNPNPSWFRGFPHVTRLFFSQIAGSSGRKPVASISYLHCLLPRVFASIRYIIFICISIYSIVQRVGAVEVLVAVVS